MSDNKVFDVVVVGDINPDLLLSGDVVPEFGQIEKTVQDADLVVGSSACIFAIGAARLGLKVAMIGKVGQDVLGQFMLDRLDEADIDTRGIVVEAEAKTGVSVVLVNSLDRAILTYPGTIAELEIEDINLDLLGMARHLHLGAFFLLKKLRPKVADLFNAACAADVSISLDTNYDPEEKWDVAHLIKEVDILFPNEIELKRISGEESLERGMERLSGERVVALKLGVKGGLVQRGQQVYSERPPEVKVVDTTGAGDSFDAGFVFAWLNDWSLQDCLRMGVICGALSTRAFGGTAAQPRLEEALSYLENYR